LHRSTLYADGLEPPATLYADALDPPCDAIRR
jgi:hypothetical protein